MEKASCSYNELQNTYKCYQGDKTCTNWGQPSYVPEPGKILVPSWSPSGGYNALTAGMGPSCNGYRSMKVAYGGLDDGGNCVNNNCSDGQEYSGFVARDCGPNYNGLSNRRCG
jgi:hypothetical protein